MKTSKKLQESLSRLVISPISENMVSQTICLKKDRRYGNKVVYKALPYPMKGGTKTHTGTAIESVNFKRSFLGETPPEYIKMSFKPYGRQPAKPLQGPSHANHRISTKH